MLCNGIPSCSERLHVSKQSTDINVTATVHQIGFGFESVLDISCEIYGGHVLKPSIQISEASHRSILLVISELNAAEVGIGCIKTIREKHLQMWWPLLTK